MTVLWHSVGRLRGEGRGVDQKQHGGGWWRLSGTVQAGAPGKQPQTGIYGKTMFKPYLPTDTERIKVKIRFE